MTILGEVVESSTARVVAQARDLYGMPDYGSLVKVVEEEENLVHYGIVHTAGTGSLDAARRPVALGKSEAELRREQPQIFSLLRSEFGLMIIGHRREGVYRSFYPPRPPRIHSFVEPCDDAAEVLSVGGDLIYLRRLLGEEGGEELAAAAVRFFRARHADPDAYTVRAGKELLRALGDDAVHFNAVMRRLA